MKYLFTIIFIFFLTACNDSEDFFTSSRNVTVVETEKYEIKPTPLPKDLTSHFWSQTCGQPILNDADKTSLSFSFLAPESDKDEVYCFEFRGESSNGDTYLDSLAITVVAPTLEIYVDHASLPTLQQLMHIIESYDNNPSNSRFVSWGRIPLDEITKEKLNIETYDLSGNNTSQALVNAVNDYIQTKNRVSLELYSNTAHAFRNLSPIIKQIFNDSKVTVKKISLYDDGSAEYTQLYNWRNTPNKIENLESEVPFLKAYLSGVSDEKEKISAMSSYNWHKLYPTDYFFLREDYLTIEPSLNDLKSYLGSSLKQMPWDLFKKLSKEKQTLFLDVVGFDKQLLQDQYMASSLPNFIFTGTTTWSGGETREFYAKQQVNVINNAINSTSPIYLGQDYDLFFKGHPRGGDINDIILNSFSDITNIPAKVSFEVLIMTDMLPDAVAGIASSLYFTLPSERVKFIVFTSSATITDREDALKSPLVQVMMKLGIIEKSSVLFWADLPNCETGTCISK